MLSAGIRPASLDNYWGYGLVLFLSATLIVMFSGPAHLSSKHRRVVHQPFPGQETL